jgi:nucleotide-binding universal stress UspA family protein
MAGLKRILAASDLSAPARHATERAAFVGRGTGASLALVHVADLAPFERLHRLVGTAPADIEQRLLEAARHRLAELARDLQERHGVAVASRVVAGRLLEALVRETEAPEVDLLVCGARGERIFRHFMLGGTALRLLGATRCPVLVVKQMPHEDYRRLLVPVDFSAASLRVIEQARRIAPRAGLVLLNVVDVPFEGHLRYAGIADDDIERYRRAARQDATRRLQALRNEAGLDPGACRLVVLHGDPTTRIVQQEQEGDCDLIVMGKHGEGLLEAMLLGSVTKHVLAESQSDVLVVV